uniref:MFS transporter n=1 Tax=uncultured Caulobacter sp. TaxID=158749 RepID=UPI0025D4E971
MGHADTDHDDWGLGRPGGWRATLAYGAAHLAKSLFWYGGEVVFAFFLTEFAGLPLSMMGLVLTVGLVFSAGMDLWVGFGFRGRMATARRAGGLQALGAVAAAIGLVAFLATPYAPQPGRWLWALATVILFRAGFALYDVPQNTLMSVAAATPAARARIAAVRIAGSGLASIAVAAFVGPLIAAHRAGGDGERMIMAVGGAAAVAAVLSAGLLAWALRHDAVAPRSTRDVVAGRGRAILLAPYLAMMAAMMIAPPLFQKLEPYFAAQVLDSASWGGVIILATAVGVTLGQPVWLAMSDRDRTRLFLVTAAIQALGAVIFLVAPSSTPLPLAFAAFLVGLGNGGLGVAKWAAFSDAASRHYPGQEGAAFAVFAASGKLTLALGVLIIVAVLEAARTDLRVLAWTMAAGPIVGS